MVRGRSRGRDKRSSDHWEPVIMGRFHGEPVDTHASQRAPSTSHVDEGGRPLKEAEYDLVMRLAIDWLHATAKRPQPCRSDETGFGDLVHSVFQWMGLRNKSAI
jgi:hypothetical protein